MNSHEYLLSRGSTRLCHFTKLQNLTHILSTEEGILASSSIRSDTKNVTDTERYDGELEYICCSVEYPNSWFLRRARQDNRDVIFREWCVMYIDLGILDVREAKICPCNASTGRGRYIKGIDQIEELFANPSIGKREISRSNRMLQACPTDGQAEILIKDNIPRDKIIGIAVGDEESAKIVNAMMKTLGMEPLPVFKAPEILTPQWREIVEQGNRPREIECVWEEE